MHWTWDCTTARAKWCPDKSDGHLPAMQRTAKQPQTLSGILPKCHLPMEMGNTAKGIETAMGKAKQITGMEIIGTAIKKD